ncbi:MAG: hypothetical protein ABW110_19360, partial [Steroidobacteraceae bacterium]
MSVKIDLPFYVERNHGITACVPADDFLHPAENAGVVGDSLTETQYFGANIPEERIQAFFYLHHHPNLKTVSGGAWVWQGIKPMPLSCEISDWLVYLSDSLLSNDLRSFTLPNSYG